MGRTIVLAHGVLGFGAIPVLSTFVSYFNGVAAHLSRQGHRISEPSVAPLGSVAARGATLADAILAASTEEKVHVIAHSMGGLDARHAIAHVPRVADRVATLVTIGTPHRGSPVADALASGAGPLLAHVPAMIASLLHREVAALRDLTTTVGQRFDETTPDSPAVRYVELAGDASRGGHHTLSLLAEMIRRNTGETNDGFVTRSSALRPGRLHLDDWPVDHFGEVGWPLVPSGPHLARYDAIVNAL